MLWTSAAILVFSTSLLIRLLIAERIPNRQAVPIWIHRILAAVSILAATCLLAAALPTIR